MYHNIMHVLSNPYMCLSFLWEKDIGTQFSASVKQTWGKSQKSASVSRSLSLSVARMIERRNFFFSSEILTLIITLWSLRSRAFYVNLSTSATMEERKEYLFIFSYGVCFERLCIREIDSFFFFLTLYYYSKNIYRNLFSKNDR